MYYKLYVLKIIYRYFERSQKKRSRRSARDALMVDADGVRKSMVNRAALRRSVKSTFLMFLAKCKLKTFTLWIGGARVGIIFCKFIKSSQARFARCSDFLRTKRKHTYLCLFLDIFVKPYFPPRFELSLARPISKEFKTCYFRLED